MPMWIAGVGAALSIKLSSSIDDVVWLAPFLTANISAAWRTQNAAIYLSVCMIQTVVAMIIAYSGDKAVAYLTHEAEGTWTTDKILTWTAAVMLSLYAVKLTIEWVQECREADTGEDKGSDNKYSTVAVSDAEEALGGEGDQGGVGMKPLSARSREVEHADEMQNQDDDEQNRSQTLFVIAFVGSVDDLTLFVPMLVGKGFDMAQLLIGGFIASTSIVLLCAFLGLCRPVADCLSRIPLAMIVIIFSLVLVTKALTMP